MQRTKYFIIGLVVVSACASLNDPEASPNPPLNELADNQASFFLNGSKHVISVYSDKNGYAPDEIVLRGWGEGLTNALMMTFKPIQGKPARIDTQMTGYWDLAFCRPSNKFLLSGDSANFIQIVQHEPGSTVYKGVFNLTFRYEKDTTLFASFTGGIFRANVDTLYSFKYCIEG